MTGLSDPLPANSKGSWLQGRELRWLFSLSIAWAVWFYVLWGLTLLANYWLEVSYSPLLDWLSIPLSILVGWIITRLLVGIWPSFLSVPDSASRLWLAGRLLILAPLVLILLVVLFAVIAGLDEILTGDPEDTWYGTSIFFAAMWYPVLLTPALTCVVVWRAVLRKMS